MEHTTGMGEGECPQYWKNKGGDTYIVLNNCDIDDNDIKQLFTYSSDYSQTSICGYLKVDTLKDSDEKYFEPWENIVTIAKNPGRHIHQEFYQQLRIMCSQRSDCLQSHTCLCKSRRPPALRANRIQSLLSV